jgi:hypothetical protein
VNLGEKASVKAHDRKARLRAERHEENMKVVLGSKEGRAVLWDILDRCKTLLPVWDSSSRIHYNAGRQELGQDLLRDILSIDGQIFLLMKGEAEEAEEEVSDA